MLIAHEQDFTLSKMLNFEEYLMTGRAVSCARKCNSLIVMEDLCLTTGKRDGMGKGLILSLPCDNLPTAKHGLYSGGWKNNMR